MRGAAVIADPLYNKGTGFSVEERRSLSLEGLLPAEVNTIERQCERIYTSIKKASEPIEQFMMLCDLHPPPFISAAGYFPCNSFKMLEILILNDVALYIKKLVPKPIVTTFSFPSIIIESCKAPITLLAGGY